MRFIPAPRAPTGRGGARAGNAKKKKQTWGSEGVGSEGGSEGEPPPESIYNEKEVSHIFSTSSPSTWPVISAVFTCLPSG